MLPKSTAVAARDGWPGYRVSRVPWLIGATQGTREAARASLVSAQAALEGEAGKACEQRPKL